MLVETLLAIELVTYLRHAAFPAHLPALGARRVCGTFRFLQNLDFGRHVKSPFKLEKRAGRKSLSPPRCFDFNFSRCDLRISHSSFFFPSRNCGRPSAHACHPKPPVSGPNKAGRGNGSLFQEPDGAREVSGVRFLLK